MEEDKQHGESCLEADRLPCILWLLHQPLPQAGAVRRGHQLEGDGDKGPGEVAEDEPRGEAVLREGDVLPSFWVVHGPLNWKVDTKDSQLDKMQADITRIVAEY